MNKSIMKVPFGYKDMHECDAAVFMCLDWRFRAQTIYCIERALNIRMFDLAGLPGSSRGVSRKSKMAKSCFTVPRDLHKVKKVFIVHHEDCGAYRGSARFNFDSEVEQRFHEDELRKSKKEILRVYPGIEVVLIYAKLVDDKESVEFFIIDAEEASLAA